MLFLDLICWVFVHSIGAIGVSATGRIGWSSAMMSAWAADIDVLCRVSKDVGRPVYAVLSTMRQAGSLCSQCWCDLCSSDFVLCEADRHCDLWRGQCDCDWPRTGQFRVQCCLEGRTYCETFAGSPCPKFCIYFLYMQCRLFVSCSAGLQVNGVFSAAVLFDVAAVRSVLPGIAGSSGSSSKTVVGARFRA